MIGMRSLKRDIWIWIALTMALLSEGGKCDLPVITYDTHNSWMWENCQGKLKDYSSYAKSASGSTLAKITKLFNCSIVYLSSGYRSKCESGKSISDFDATVQSYYKDCIVAYIDEGSRVCELETSCSQEYDSCTECLSQSVCASYKKAGSSQRTSYEAAKSSRCFAANQNCSLETLGPIAYSSCRDYYYRKCEKAWLDANPKDVCNISCSRLVYAFANTLKAFYSIGIIVIIHLI